MLGDGPLADAIASGLSRDGPVVLAGPVPRGGRWFWRRVDLATGEGVKAAVARAGQVVVVVEDPELAWHGAFLGLRAVSSLPGAVVHLADVHVPSGANELAHWARLRVGAWWGPHLPLVRTWKSQVAAGKPLSVPDLDVGVLAEFDVVNAVRESLHRKQARWQLAGPSTPYRELALAIHEVAGVEPRIRTATPWWAATRAGVSREAFQRPASLPRAVIETPDVTLEFIGRAGWTADPEEVENTEPGAPRRSHAPSS